MKVWECIYEHQYDGKPSDGSCFPKFSKQTVKFVDSEDKAKEFVKSPSTVLFGKTIPLQFWRGMAYYIERDVE